MGLLKANRQAYLSELAVATKYTPVCLPSMTSMIIRNCVYDSNTMRFDSGISATSGFARNWEQNSRSLRETGIQAAICFTACL